MTESRPEKLRKESYEEACRLAGAVRKTAEKNEPTLCSSSSYLEADQLNDWKRTLRDAYRLERESRDFKRLSRPTTENS